MTNVQILEKMRLVASGWATPGLAEFIESRPTIRAWLVAAEKELDDRGAAPEDEFEVVAHTYARGIRKAAKLHSEAEWTRLQSEGGSALDLDLRFGRYVNLSVDLVDPRGKPYRLFGTAPVTPPPSEIYWGTCQDWLDALGSNATIDMVRVFGRLPCNEQFLMLAPGQVVTSIDVTKKEGPEVKTTTVKRVQLGLF